MTHRIALFASLLLVAAAPCVAQSPASATTDKSATSPAAPASSTATSSQTAPAAAGTDSAASAAKPASAATDASADPSPELVKQARREGFTPKKRDGVTKFCQKSAKMNTHFETETCVDEAHLKMLVEQREDQRNLMRQQGACVGSNCKSGP